MSDLFALWNVMQTLSHVGVVFTLWTNLGAAVRHMHFFSSRIADNSLYICNCTYNFDMCFRCRNIVPSSKFEIVLGGDGKTGGEQSLVSATRALELAKSLQANDILITLISGMSFTRVPCIEY